MSKIVKTVIVVAIAVAVVVFAPQIAAVLASVAGSLGVTVAATAISSALIGMGISMALTAAATLFRKAPSMSQSMVDRLNTSVVPTASRKIIFGTTAGGADVRFFEGDLDLPSTKKDGYVQVVALASHRINALKQFYVETIWFGRTVRSYPSATASHPIIHSASSPGVSRVTVFRLAQVAIGTAAAHSRAAPITFRSGSWIRTFGKAAFRSALRRLSKVARSMILAVIARAVVLARTASMIKTPTRFAMARLRLAATPHWHC